MKVIIVLVGLVLGSMSANAQDVSSGNIMLQGCEDAISNRATFLAGVCAGIIEGLRFGGPTLDKGLAFCVPNNIARGQAIRVVLKFMNEHPQDLHEDFIVLASVSLLNIWPCKK